MDTTAIVVAVLSGGVGGVWLERHYRILERRTEAQNAAIDELCDILEGWNDLDPDEAAAATNRMHRLSPMIDDKMLRSMAGRSDHEVLQRAGYLRRTPSWRRTERGHLH